MPARVVPDGVDEIHGLRTPGTGLPGVIMVGTCSLQGALLIRRSSSRHPNRAEATASEAS
jgi:hypothetical protein